MIVLLFISDPEPVTTTLVRSSPVISDELFMPIVSES